ncbi:hypothetical protein BD408DRAFT_421955 [Parasitella parasitica]|nr:hypothetical protein BD408DRAFT_421955 [Parasitella parasitica]
MNVLPSKLLGTNILSFIRTYLCSCLTGNSKTLIHQAPRDWFKRSWSYCCGTVK